MKNIFKIFQENEKLLKENEILKAQNESLTQFRKEFEEYYFEISNPKVIKREDNNIVTLNGVYTLDDVGVHIPTDECKKVIIKKNI